MNQIILNMDNTPKNQENLPSNNHLIKKTVNNKFNFQNFYKYLFIISIVIIFSCIIIYFFIRYNAYKKEKFSKNLINNFNISTLYANSTDLSVERINYQAETPFVIGLIEINKIDIIYPILSTTTEELLKIAPCRFYGPMPNSVGNLCIAGHNYANNKIFGKLHYLDIGDIIKIYDLNGNSMEYKVYSKLEVTSDDTSCIAQNTDGKKEVTLITCNTLKGNRLVFKCAP